MKSMNENNEGIARAIFEKSNAIRFFNDSLWLRDLKKIVFSNILCSWIQTWTLEKEILKVFFFFI